MASLRWTSEATEEEEEEVDLPLFLAWTSMDDARRDECQLVDDNTYIDVDTSDDEMITACNRVEWDLFGDTVTMNSTWTRMKSDDKSRIDDNRQDSSNAMSPIRNHRIWSVRIRDEDQHEWATVQSQPQTMTNMDSHGEVSQMFDRYCNSRWEVELISKTRTTMSFLMVWSVLLFALNVYLAIGDIDSKVGQLFKLSERLSVYPITLAWEIRGWGSHPFLSFFLSDKKASQMQRRLTVQFWWWLSFWWRRWSFTEDELIIMDSSHLVFCRRRLTRRLLQMKRKKGQPEMIICVSLFIRQIGSRFRFE